ncbi:MAG: hypothetical protein KJZ86_07770 [Caldilineaceae bacterium]|nr:hypothetical protein [Caldilineaceae bacterium]
MATQTTITLYHGTDWESALDILNSGLNVANLRRLQSTRTTQLSPGWYLAESPDIAWYFASLAPGSTEGGYTVIEMEVDRAEMQNLLARGSAIRRQIINVPFSGEQYWISPDAFAFLNARAVFRPYTGEDVGER